jgi:hypothetical protein
MHLSFFVLITFFLLPVCAFAGPPIFTDDTGTPGPRNWEINIGADIDKRHNATHYDAPSLDLNYGIREHIQLNYSVSWIVLDSRDEGTHSGLSNSELAVKWRFLDEGKHGIAISVYPRLIINNPTNSAARGLADKGTAFRLPVQLEKKIGVINFNLEFGHEFRRDDEWIYGLALKYSEIKGTELLAEIFGTADKDFNRNVVVSNIGIRFEVGAHYSVLASIGRSLHSAPDQPTLLSYLGLQLRY